MLQPYPQPDETNVDLNAEQGIEWIKGIIVAIRNIRGEMDISPAKAIPVFLNKGTASDQAKLEEYRPYLEKLAKLESIQWLNPDEEVPAAATQLHGDVEILVPMAGLIDVEAERARLEKEIAKLESGMAGCICQTEQQEVYGKRTGSGSRQGAWKSRADVGRIDGAAGKT